MKRIVLTIIFALFLIPFLAYSQTVEDFSDETISSNTITTNTGLVISSDLVWSTYSNELVYNDVTMSPPIPYINPSTINNYFEISLNDQNQVLSSISFDLWLNYYGVFGTGDMGCDCKSYTSENQLIETISKGSNEVAKNFIFNSGLIKKIICNPTNVEGGNGLFVDDIVFVIAQLENNNDILLNGTTSAENNQIKNIADPTDSQDAATKNYVDSNVNAFSGSYSDLTDTPLTITTQQASDIITNNAKTTFPGFGTTSGTALAGDTALFSGSYNDLTDKPTTYTQSEVDALISDLQDQIDALQSATGSGSVTDQNGNSYPYLTYGNQVWTVGNAEMVTYRDGTEIPQVTDDTAWENLTTGAWAYYDNDPTKPRLYNWYAVMGIHDTDPNTPNKEFAPEGWHVPTDAEWTTLENYLIANGYNYDDTTTGSKIAKAMASTTGWNSSTEPGAPGNDQSLNNSSGFNAFPEGYRSPSDLFQDEGGGAYFWCSTVFSELNAWYRYLGGDSSYLYGYGSDKRHGFSVRFVRN